MNSRCWLVRDQFTGDNMKTIRKVELKWTRILLAKDNEDIYDPKLHSSKDAAPIMRTLLRDEVVENFLVLLLTVKNQVLGFDLVSKGGVGGCAMQPADVFRGAIIGGAAKVILGHNHPSGDPKPSPEDLELTERLVQAGKLLGIEVLDHIIIGEKDFYSMADTGVLKGA